MCADVVAKLGYRLNSTDNLSFWFEAPSDVLDVVTREATIM